MNKIKLFTILVFTFFLTQSFAESKIKVEGVYHEASAFIGPTANQLERPVEVESFMEYLKVYGWDFDQPESDVMALGARSFFQNGGEKLYVVSVEAPSIENYLEAVEKTKALNVDLVAAPGLAILEENSFYYLIYDELIQSLKERSRFLLIDPPKQSSKDDLLNLSSSFQTNLAALFAPWVHSNFQNTPLPPSFAVAGIITRLDRKRGMYRTAAGVQAVVKGISGLEKDFENNDAGELNQASVNLLRFIDQLDGHYVWGGRVLNQNNYSPYIPVHRFQSYLKHSIENSLKGKDFSVQGDQLEEKLESLIEQFFYSYFKKGAFAGQVAHESYFVHCQVVPSKSCELGVALVKPAEFSVFRTDLD